MVSTFVSYPWPDLLQWSFARNHLSYSYLCCSFTLATWISPSLLVLSFIVQISERFDLYNYCISFLNCLNKPRIILGATLRLLHCDTEVIWVDQAISLEYYVAWTLLSWSYVVSKTCLTSVLDYCVVCIFKNLPHIHVSWSISMLPCPRNITRIWEQGYW